MWMVARTPVSGEPDHLRHSKFVGLREDKDARTVIKEHGGEGNFVFVRITSQGNSTRLYICRGYIRHFLKTEKEIPNQSAARIFADATPILKAGSPGAGSH
jgi:hypothetical protein